MTSSAKAELFAQLDIEERRLAKLLDKLERKTSREVVERCFAAVDDEFMCQGGWVGDNPKIAKRTKAVAAASGAVRRGAIRPREQEAYIRRHIYGKRRGRTPHSDEYVRMEARVVAILTAANLQKTQARQFAANLISSLGLGPTWQRSGVKPYALSAEAIRKRRRRK